MIPKPVIVVDLGFGDAGKGVTVDRLASQWPGSTVVIRYNGGCQAAHNVIRDDGTHHTFSQFGSGALAGAKTFLSRYMMVEPFSLLNEARHLQECGITNPLDDLFIDRECLLTTPYHQLLNQAREEARGANRHGSVGRGIGETASYALTFSDAPRMKDFEDWANLAAKLARLRLYVHSYLPQLELPEVDALIDGYRTVSFQMVDGAWLGAASVGQQLIFEGAQGVLLDEWHGFHPHTTWSTATSHNANVLLREIGLSGFVLGVTRTYHTRHGAGPFPTEDPSLLLPELHNAHDQWMGSLRVGHFDSVLFHYAVRATSGVDAVAITHWDRRDNVRHCVGYKLGTLNVTRLPPARDHNLLRQEALGRMLRTAQPMLKECPAESTDFYGVPIYSKGYGPRTSDYDTMTASNVSHPVDA